MTERTARLIHADGIKIHRRLYEDLNPDPEIKERNMANAFSMVQMYREIATGYLNVLTEPSRHFLMGLLGDQKQRAAP